MLATFVAVGASGVGRSNAAQVTYRAYVACSRSHQAVPAHRCPRGSRIGAFFKSSEETTYTVCVHFPDARSLCARGQGAEAGELNVNSITTRSIGTHDVIWEVGGTRIVRHFVLTR